MKVLVIEDSRVVREYVCLLLRAEPDIEVVEAADGEAGLAAARTERPDVILTDLQLPGLDGVDVIRTVMSERPCPTIVLSSHLHDSDPDLAFVALAAGAVEVIAKPTGLDRMRQDHFARSLLRTVRLMAEVPLISRRRSQPPSRSALERAVSTARVDLLAIGASTGGPPLLHEMLKSLVMPLSIPIIVVQHIIPGFEQGFARWLGKTGYDVRVAQHGDRITAGRIYLAPGAAELCVDKDGCLRLSPLADRVSATNSIDALFESVARYYGPHAWGVLLTGMGKDGATGLLSMKQQGAFTIVQDGMSSTIDGMPAEARRIGAATEVMTPAEIWALLRARFEKRSKKTV